MTTLMWFRENDLRCRDNTALYEASLAASQTLLGLFIVAKHEWEAHHFAPIKQDFILRQLKTLSIALSKLNIPLIILASSSSTPPHNTTTLVTQILNQYKVTALFFNQQFGVDERKRDEMVLQYCQKSNIKTRSFIDHIVFKPDEILTGQKKYYTVFTPFKKQWLSKLDALVTQGSFDTYPAPRKRPPCSLTTPIFDFPATSTSAGFSDSSAWPVGEENALKILDNFIAHKIKHYQRTRDFPAIDGTSKLSPYLAAGLLSPRQCVQKILQHKDLGSQTWLSELIWREFYQHVLKNFPRVSMGKPFQLNTDKIQWNTDKAIFEAWKTGQTGFPIIDAAMNQLNQTGWMHNRLRMITAMFLSKNGLINWRQGERYFMEHLIDGDLAANNGGWQWCASTGTDAVPYFRIFNPELQTKRFDPQREFIKQYCPEFESKSYPKPIVDLTESRKRAIDAYRRAQHHTLNAKI